MLGIVAALRGKPYKSNSAKPSISRLQRRRREPLPTRARSLELVSSALGSLRYRSYACPKLERTSQTTPPEQKTANRNTTRTPRDCVCPTRNAPATPTITPPKPRTSRRYPTAAPLLRGPKPQAHGLQMLRLNRDGVPKCFYAPALQHNIVGSIESIDLIDRIIHMEQRLEFRFRNRQCSLVVLHILPEPPQLVSLELPADRSKARYRPSFDLTLPRTPPRESENRVARIRQPGGSGSNRPARSPRLLHRIRPRRSCPNRPPRPHTRSRGRRAGDRSRRAAVPEGGGRSPHRSHRPRGCWPPGRSTLWERSGPA